MNSDKAYEPEANIENHDISEGDRISEKIEKEYTAIAKRNDLYRWITISVYVLIVSVAGATIFFGFRYVNSRLRSLNAQISEQQERLAKQQALTQASINDVSNLSEKGLTELGEKLPQLKELFTTTYLAQAQRIRLLDDNLGKFSTDVNTKLSENERDKTDLKANLNGVKADLNNLGSTLSQYKKELDNTSQLIASTKKELQQLIASTASASDDKTQSAKAELKSEITKVQVSIQSVKGDLEKVNVLSNKNKGEVEGLKGTVEQLRVALRQVGDTEKAVQDLRGKVDGMLTKLKQLEASREQNAVAKLAAPQAP